MGEVVKIVVFVPETHAQIVRQTMGDTGAGVIGNYSHCSFSSKGIGSFKALKGANPTMGGVVGKQEEVAEERIEMVCPKNKVREITAAIKKVHPYEEVALDIYPLIKEDEL